ncbi:MAG: 7-carboxy-7-deazaguanine synthase [Candidatus Anoxychlamydiales bacterium]|nr:7-carboxy-7-deazaguanine synthase [Candidatus Anoxychlamydiales bacterium]
MYKLMENVLVVCKNDSTYYLDPESLVVFSKKNPKSSNEEIIRKYNKSKGAKQKNRTDNNSKTSTAIIELHVTNDCNLRCKYCFVDEKCHEEKYKQMSEDVIEKALFFALNSYLEASFFQICLFGGEPMLFWKKLNYLVKKAKEILDFLFN